MLNHVHDRIAALRWDVILYAGCAVFAAGLAATTSLPTHLRWAQLAMVGYAVGAVVASGLLLGARHGVAWAGGLVARGGLATATWLAVAMVPLSWLILRRQAGQAGTAQEEVRVVEWAGERWREAGSPYLGRDAITELPPAEQLEAYLPYQPGMAGFGIPRAMDPTGAWWSDARVWFLAVTLIALAAAVLASPRGKAAAVLRALQVSLVVPTAALATAVGGDDLPVLASCLLALALAARGRFGAAGLAIGAAGALKLIAWPVAVVLAGYAATRGRANFARYGWAAVTVPLVALLPAGLADPIAVVENTIRFPLGLGVVTSPAEAPLPGHLIANRLPGGPVIATALLLATGFAMAIWLLRRPPRTVAAVAGFSASGLLAAAVLMPATRAGYLLYPLALLAWLPALRPAPAAKETVTDDALPGRDQPLLATPAVARSMGEQGAPGWRWSRAGAPPTSN